LLEAISKIPIEKKNSTSELNESEIVFDRSVLSVRDPAKVSQPSKESFDFPSSFVAAQLSFILTNVDPIGFMRCDELDPFLCERFSKSIIVVSSVSNESFWNIGKKTLFESFVYKGDFSR
jgi:hypothetical protein